MAVIETWFHQDLQEPVKVNYLNGNLFSNNGNGNRIGIVLTNNGENLASISGTVSGYVVTADGSTVPCTGSKSGNRASILIPAAAYQPGSIFITVFVTDGTTVTTIGAVCTTVMRSRTNAQVDPGSTVTDWTQTINAAMQSVETAAANLGGIIATPYASLTYPVPLGKYTYYNGNLYRCISPIATSETFTPAHWTAVKLGDDVSDLKSALKQSVKDETVIYIKNKTYSSFVQGGRVAPNAISITTNPNRCTVDRVWYLHPGDKIRISNIASGQRAVVSAVDLDGNLILSGDWVTTDTETVVSIEGYYYVVASKTNGSTAISPSEVTTKVTITDESSRIAENEKCKNVIDTGFSKVWEEEDISQGYWYAQSISYNAKRVCNTSKYDVQAGDILRIASNPDGWYFAIGIYIGASTSLSYATGWVTGDNYDYVVQEAGKLVFFFQTALTESASQNITPSDFSLTMGMVYKGYIENIWKLINPDTKTIAFLGDSLTAGVGTSKIYHMYLADRFGWHCKNYGYGGSGYAYSFDGTGGKMATGQEGMGINITSSTMFTPNDFLTRIATITTDIDALVIFGGTNDWGKNSPFDNFQTAVDAVLNYAQTHFGRIPIIVMLPIHRENDTNPNSVGKTLIDYCEVIKEKCHNHGIMCIDMMGISGLNPENENNNTLYFVRDDTGVSDKVHPNHYAHKYMSNLLAGVLVDSLY
jgi:lysophospholipase L1-like esterase